ncbi:MAG: hypothetical protein NTW87_07275 [Planctomycetota bacterium]|nr:hypothetical protein [Planctomycetota bacterium]
MSRALLIEDCVELREFLAELLVGEGFGVTVAADWGAALAALDSRLDIILMSRSVAGSGPEAFMAEVRRRDLASLVVLMASVIDEDELRRLGIRNALPKPMPVARLRRILSVCVQQGPKALALACAAPEAQHAADK